ncbi:HDOD domain-containing protein [Amphritea sp.]|uniref:HDOD domain-containing protein n=1 Tax=Amphritea sp. TaxID=1872502 RepID=UPI0025C4A098|nr:HDOD domain-containing protein [Amphritea sp.]
MLKEIVRTKLTLEMIENRIQSIPAFPTVVCELMELAHDADGFFEKMGNLAEKSPLLASRILSFANSAASAPSSPIINIHDALIRLGIFKTLSMITMASVSRNLPLSKPQYRAIWSHSIETAYLSRHIAENLPDFHVDKGLVYLCGLLHDLGRFVFLQISSKIIDVIEALGWDTYHQLSDIEYKLFGFTHVETGTLAAKKWQLPETISQVIQHHHQFDLWQKEEGTLEFRQRLTIVQFADSICTLIQRNPEWRDWSDSILKERIIKDCIHKNWPTIDFNVDQLISNLPDLIAECNEVSKEMGVELGD